MSSRRPPKVRASRVVITDEAVAIFRRCVEAEERDDYDSWWEIQNELHAELKMRPWEWPCIPQPPRGAHDHRWAFKLRAKLEAAAS